MEYFVLVLLFAIVYLMIFGVPKGWLKNKKKGDSVDDYIAKRQTQYTQSELDDFDRRHADVLNADYGYVNKPTADKADGSGRISGKINEQPLPVGLTFPSNSFGNYYITYERSNGNVSKRAISVISENGYYVYAYCHLRNAKRTFVIDNIIEAINLETGELVNDIVEDMYENYKNTPKGKQEHIINTEIHAVRILLFIARADGRMVKSERQLIVDFLKNNNYAADPNTLDQLIKGMMEPSHKEFKSTVADMAKKDKPKLALLYDYAQKIVARGETIDPLEEAALKIMKNALT